MQPSMPPPGLSKKPVAAIGIDVQPTGDESAFSCPACGAKIRCEPAEESDAEHEALGMEDAEQ